MSQPTTKENRQWIHGLAIVCLVLLYKVFVLEDNKKITSSGLVDKEGFRTGSNLALTAGSKRSGGYGEPTDKEGYTTKRFKEGYSGEAPVFWNVGDLSMIKNQRETAGRKEGFNNLKPY